MIERKVAKIFPANVDLQITSVSSNLTENRTALLKEDCENLS